MRDSAVKALVEVRVWSLVIKAMMLYMTNVANGANSLGRFASSGSQQMIHCLGMVRCLTNKDLPQQKFSKLLGPAELDAS